MNTALDGTAPIETDTLALQQPCPVCGNQEFEWGRMPMTVYYLPGLTRLWTTMRQGRQVIKVRRCLRCNNLLQFTDDSLTKRQNSTTIIVVILAMAFALATGLGTMLIAMNHAVR